MKRNRLPDQADQLVAEQQIVTERLNELFSREASSSSKLRNVPISSIGHWISDRNHVRVESTRGISSHLLSFSTEFKYDYMNPYEALYSLETNQLLIHHNQLPLSLVEAYQLLLGGSVKQFTRYRVFQHLNRSGFVCHQHSTATRTQTGDKNNDNEFVVDVDDGDDDVDGIGGGDGFSIVFDMYKRENFTKNKPRKGKQGNPDYLLVICDDLVQMPKCKQLLRLEEYTSKPLLFALIDDNSIFFTKFEQQVEQQ